MTKNLGNTLLNVNFTGGEPFARKDIIDIAKLYIKNTTIQSIYVTTNGSLPDRILEFAQEINKFDKNIEINFVFRLWVEYSFLRTDKGCKCNQNYTFGATQIVAH